MHEVSCRLFLMLEAGCAARGIPGERLVEGTRLPLARMRDASQRLSWDEFTALCERAAELVGSPAGLEDVGAIAIQAPAASPLRSLAGLFTGPTSVYRLGAVWFAPMMVYNLHFDFEQLGRDRVRVTIDVPPPYAPNEAFMHVTRGAIRAAPQLVGKPEATVEARITPQHATYDITLPALAPLRKRVRRALRVLLNANMVIDELAAQQRSIRESALARERLEHDFRRVIDGLPDGVLIHSGGVIRYANPAWLSYLGLPPGTDLAGRHATEFLHADDPARQARPFLGAGRHGSGGDLRLQRADGSTVLLEAAAAQPVEFDGPATLLSARDVTERKQTELQVALTDRMVAVGTLAAGAAHEINNPLSYVLANLRQIGRVLARLSDRLSGESLSDLLAMLDDAREGAERVRDVVGGLAAFSRADDAELGPVDVHTVLERALKMASNEIRHRARLVRVYGDVPPVRANEVRLAQVFLNLLVNAAQAIPVGRADVH
jgi:PAS domain S-box-containing protein